MGDVIQPRVKTMAQTAIRHTVIAMARRKKDCCPPVPAASAVGKRQQVQQHQRHQRREYSVAKCPAGCILQLISSRCSSCAEAATNSEFKDEEAGFAVNGGRGWAEVVFRNHQVETFSPVAYAMGDYAFTDTISGNRCLLQLFSSRGRARSPGATG